MMKGLFNYETAYRRYTRLFLEDLMRDNIQYAEIRPNFMTSNPAVLRRWLRAHRQLGYHAYDY